MSPRGRVAPGTEGREGPVPVAPRMEGPILRLALVLVLLLGGVAAGATWWQVAEAARLSADPLDPRRLAAVAVAVPGRILAADGRVLAEGGGGDRPERRYPVPEAAPITGYRSALLGTAGLERTWDAELTGLRPPGGAGELLRKLRTDPWAPHDVITSIDLRLQRLGASLLGEDRGAIVILEPATGRILALVSSPVAEMGALSAGATARETLDALRDDPAAPLLVRPTQGLYVPGSVFKLVTAAAALESGAIDASTTFAGQPRWSREGLVVDGYRIRDAPRESGLDAPLTLAEALEVSSNVWFANAALETGPEALAATARRLGIGTSPPFELPVAAGQLGDGDGPLGGFADRAELASTGFGQAEVLVTPLQVALVAAAIANGGELMAPRLTDRLVGPDGSVTEIGGRSLGRLLSPGTAGILRDAMRRAVEGPGAAGLAGGAKVPGVPTAGKSGTAELGPGERPHSWFVGFVPADAPRFVVAVVVENGGFGAERAVPIGGRLLREALRRVEPGA